MSGNRYTKPRDDEPAQQRQSVDRPTHCEVTGCQSMYLGTNASGVPIRKRGKADVFVTVNDRVRGVCCRCYALITQRDGTATNADLRSDVDGGYDLTKVRSHWDSLAQMELDEVAKRKHYGREVA